jgi:hypothetical protein
LKFAGQVTNNHVCGPHLVEPCIFEFGFICCFSLLELSVAQNRITTFSHIFRTSKWAAALETLSMFTQKQDKLSFSFLLQSLVQEKQLPNVLTGVSIANSTSVSSARQDGGVPNAQPIAIAN